MKRRVLFVLIVVVLLFTITFVGSGCANDKDKVGAYILTDKATFLSMKKNADGDMLPNLDILLEQTDQLKNTYTLIAVDPNGSGFKDAKPTLNTVGADALIRWFNKESTRQLIKEYGKDLYGEALFTLLAEAPHTYSGEIALATEETKTIELSTTTSVKDSGLLAAILPVFEKEYGYTVNVFAKGTGISIANAQSGNADLILVHAKSQEEAFVSAGYARKVEGFGQERVSFMYNYFVICGNPSDPAGVKKCSTAGEAFKAIAKGQYNFVSRGDASGTHSAEIKLWATAGYDNITFTKESDGTVTINSPKEYVWYNALGKGMGASLTTANAMATKNK